tara:strand:+ start:85 stop:267 length:183 start_codon:yes stop_codon:yes gene_type:complete
MSIIGFTLSDQEPINPVVYLTNQVKKLDIKKRNGYIALFLVNLFVVLLFKLILNSFGFLN